MMATASDLAKLSDGLTPGRLISAKSCEEMVAPVVLNDGSTCSFPLPGATGTYGYGLEIVSFDQIAGHRAIGKSGIITGFSGYFTVFEGTGLAIAVLSNQDGSIPLQRDADPGHRPEDPGERAIACSRARFSISAMRSRCGRSIIDRWVPGTSTAAMAGSPSSARQARSGRGGV